MKKLDKTEREIRLEEKINQLKAENKKLKERDKYAKKTKAEMKAEIKQLKAELGEEVKKTPDSRESSDRRHWQNLERKIRERFPEETARSVLSELASNFMLGQEPDSEESPKS